LDAPIKVFIDNWPGQDLVVLYAPILIAALALLGTLYSAYLSRKAFRLSSRPYIWAASYGHIDQQGALIPLPNMLAFRIKNSPAKVEQSSIAIILGSEEVFSFSEVSYVRFPDDSSDWSFTIGNSEWDAILQKYRSSNEKLIRNVSVEYGTLGERSRYEYHLIQEFISADNQWKDVNSEAC
jgi:hypothetical protein